MELIEIEAFVTIAEQRGFGRAAATLRISQPAISRRIDLLERELGSPLFERVHTGARLTAIGEAFLPHAQAALASLRDGVAAVDAVQHGARGTITLALVGTLASTALTRRVQRFRQTHPGIRLLLRTARSDEVSDLVRTGEANLGLRYFSDSQPEIVSVPSGEEALIVVCAAENQLADRQDIPPEALRGIPWVAFPTDGSASGESYTRILERQLLRAGLDDAEIIAIDSLTAQKRLIESGFGIGLLPQSSVEEELRLGSLRRVDVPAMQTTVPIVAIRRRRGYLSPAMAALLAALTGDA